MMTESRLAKFIRSKMHTPIEMVLFFILWELLEVGVQSLVLTRGSLVTCRSFLQTSTATIHVWSHGGSSKKSKETGPQQTKNIPSGRESA
eukprot:894055-Amphidinium_carterae.1